MFLNFIAIHILFVSLFLVIIRIFYVQLFLITKKTTFKTTIKIILKYSKKFYFCTVSDF